MPRVRIVTPTYNRVELLSQALDSVSGQTFRDFEIVVIDDGSTDGTPDMLKTLAQRDARVRSFRANRLGPARARNAALAQPGNHEYVAFLDSDDLWLPHHLARTVQVLDENPEVALVFGRIATFDATGTWSEERLAEREERTHRPRQYSVGTHGPALLLDPIRYRRALIRNDMQPHPSASLIRASAVRGDWFDTSLEILEDTQLFMRLALTNSFAFIDDVHAKARYHGDNLSGVADLRSAQSLVRCSCMVRYAKWRLTLCETSDDRATVESQVADHAYLLGQCWSERGELGNARRAYLESLRYRQTYAALKGLLAASLPSPIFRSLRKLRHGSGA